MNPVEIEQAVSVLAEQPFDAAEFAFAFLEAFGNKETTIKRLRSGASNKSDLGGVLQTNNIHIAVCSHGEVTKTLVALKASPATTRAKAKFVLASDGDTLEAEDVESGETVACAYVDFPDHFGFFLPLAGISTVKQLRDSSFDIRATSRLNRLYVELLKDNPDWGTAERRLDMNHFMARLIFCFFAEDTDIFNGTGLFTDTISQMSARDSSDTHDVIGALFRAMNTKKEERGNVALPRWADALPYVNGGLFSGDMDVPRFSRMARSYLLHIGNLDWTKINPDIFGSMIQAVADDEERGALGMHYTSVPNILKVLNPLFLEDLRAQLKEADNNKFDERRQSGNESVIAVAAISSENRDYLPCGVLPRGTIISNKCFALFNAPLWNMALVASRLHWVWIATVCVRMRTDFSYSNTLGWNTFPVPTLTDKNKADLTRCAEDVLLAREEHFPKTIADLYDPEHMPADLREAHERNDEVLERIYIGRRFKNDTERLEKLFELYTKMTAGQGATKKRKAGTSA